MRLALSVRAVRTGELGAFRIQAGTRPCSGDHGALLGGHGCVIII
jgi:hypothetical protein